MTKISQLSDIGANLAGGDEFVIRDVSDAVTPNKKVTSSGIIDYVIGTGSVTGFTKISAGAGPLSEVACTFSGSTGKITATSSNFTIDSNGRVGIGTSSPQALLHLNSGTNFDAVIKVSDFNQSAGILALGDGLSTNVNVGVWRAAANSYSSGGNWLNLGGYDGISFATGNFAIGSQNRAMTIDSSGRLLVGTSSNSGGAIIQSAGSVQASVALRFPANNKNGATTRATAIETISTDGGTNNATVYADARYGANKWVFLAGFDSSGNAINSTTSATPGATFVFCITDAATNFPTT